jgi:hypothetical protein
MRRVVPYMMTSVDGFIAGPDGDLDTRLPLTLTAVRRFPSGAALITYRMPETS